MSEINITIDGKNCAGLPGETILACAERYGINIPAICQAPGISHNTSCFVCVVKEVRSGRMLPSCSYKITPGLDVESEVAEVKAMRRASLNLLLSEHRGDCEAPCTKACPAEAKVEEYVRAGQRGDHLTALKIIKERIPLPMSIGRVCPRFCEKDCRRNVLDKEPVAINDFKRLAADLHYDSFMEELPPLGKKRVAVVGAGPAGFAAAYFLRMNGVASDLFEARAQGGGMLRYGIPEYRLPKGILDKELAHFAKMGGIKVNYGRELGRNLTMEELERGYDAVCVTIGSWHATELGAQGDNFAAPGIVWLEKIASEGWRGTNPGKTIVIGGGNTAMDCVRTSVRLGSPDVICCYRRTEMEMPAEKIEVEEAREEGVKFMFLTAPVKLEERNGRKLLTCIKMALGEPDASGRRRPVPVAGSEFTIEADTVISAVGQKTKAPSGISLNKWGDVAVDKADNHVGGKVFAAGDCVTGPASVVEAVAGARKAALGVLAWFEGDKYQAPAEINVSRGRWQHLAREELVFLREPPAHGREKQPLIPVAQRKQTFDEVSGTFTSAMLEREGSRCIECSCTAKHDCALKCHSEAYGANPTALAATKAALQYDVSHPKIILDRGKCVKCGVCIKVCKEVVGKSLLGFKNRGSFTVVGTLFDQPLDASCSDCGKCIELCPVGALAWRHKE